MYIYAHNENTPMTPHTLVCTVSTQRQLQSIHQITINNDYMEYRQMQNIKGFPLYMDWSYMHVIVTVLMYK